MLLYPLKYSFDPLYSTGSDKLPVKAPPSQYIREIFVQSWKVGFSALFVERIPLKDAESEALFVEPKGLLLRW